MKKNLVIVEAPTKAKTIEGYLGPDFKVVASYGHVRQLSSTPDGITVDDDVSFNWVTDDKKVSNLLKAIDKNTEKIYLATDMDREGEAISWHIAQIIKEKGYKIPMSRIFFFEITKSAIKNALAHEREIDINLVNAYFARVGLDHKVGFSVSPILWRQFPFLKNTSAGRVQSPALRIITEREFERNNFNKKKYYSITGDFKSGNTEFDGKLVRFEEEKIKEDFDDKEKMEHFLRIMDKNFTVSEVLTKNLNVRPDAPFITSTLQQESSRRYGMKLADIMKTAQELYEGIAINGKNNALITYMRTDSTNMSSDAMKQIRDYIAHHFAENLPEKPNVYKDKIKNAQEAHECIRPVDINLNPDDIKHQLSDNQYKIYKIIWQRAIASQMKNAIKEQMTFSIVSKNAEFRTTTTVIKKPGFLSIYDSEKSKNHLNLKQGSKVESIKLDLNEHETQPPGRFSEATLIQELVKHGIGRPSTYATIPETLTKREYIEKKQKFIAPTFKGNIICVFLKAFFSKYMDYKFTANIEEILDEIANGHASFIDILKQFVNELNEQIENKKKINIIEAMEIISLDITNGLKQVCPDCGESVQLRMKFSFFFFCEKCNKTIKIEEEANDIDSETKVIKTPNYQYIMKNGVKCYLPQKFNEELNEKTIQLLLSLPYEVCKLDGKPIIVGMSKYGFYLKYEDKYFNLYFKQLVVLSNELACEIIKKPKKPYNSNNKYNNKDKTVKDNSMEIIPKDKKPSRSIVKNKITKSSKKPKNNKI